MWGQLLLQLILIALNAVFACAEIAVLSVNEAKIAKLEESGNKKAKKLRKLTAEPSKFLSTIQVAITLSGFLGSAFAADNFATRLVNWLVDLGVKADPDVLQNAAVVVITLILSYFTLILGELVPKRIAMKKSEQMAIAMSSLLYAVSKLFSPVVWFLSVSTNGVLRLFGIDPNEQDEDVSEEEILLMVDEGSQKGVIDEQEQELIQNVFDFDDLMVSEFATHRTDIAFLWLEDDDETWESTIHETRHSMYPVCEDMIDNVVGVLSIKDYFRLKGADRETMIKEAVKPAYFVPEGIHADVLFKKMKQTRNHFAIVLDEYGGTFGIVTMNDLLQQIVGDFDDADSRNEEEEAPDIMQISDDTWEIKGVVPLEDAAKALEIELPTDLFDTIGGYVFSKYGVVPEDGTEFEIEIEPLHIHVTEIKDHRIVKMTVRRDVIEEEEDEEEEENQLIKLIKSDKSEKSDKSDKSEKSESELKDVKESKKDSKEKVKK
ncbi:MAG: HlyC/CorC family transporter [Ruminococcaceae bacterium]|nr:HlyC/CorC family transporter [Oscillospiraceae bacterium]